MFSYWENIFFSIGTFVSLFVFYTLVICFWGRLVLWLARLEKKPCYGDPLTIVAGGVLFAFVGWNLQEFILNFRSYLVYYFYGGALLAVLELIILRIPGFFRQPDKKSALAQLIQSHNILFGAIVMAVVLAFFHSAIWESGQMEVWLFGGADHLNWPFLADYWQGLYDPAAMNFSRLENACLRDSFGSQVLLALWAMASGQTALFAVSGFLITIVIWSGMAIIALVRKIFSLGFWSTWLISLGVIGGGLFTYLVFRGQSGQLVATVGYLVAIRELFLWPDRPSFQDKVRLFLPVFFMFLAYQGGFFALVFVLALTAATRHFCLFNWGFSFLGLLKSCMVGVKPVIQAALGCALLTPFLAYWLVVRSFETATQIGGWKISFINPFFFLSGLPFFRREYFDETNNQLAPNNWWYLLFFTILLWLIYLTRNKFLIISAFDIKKTINKNIDLKKIYCITIVFIITIILYIISYYAFDNRYQVWKFLTYVGLPLSFVPTALLVLVITDGKNRLFKGLFYGLLICLVCIIGVKVDVLKDITSFKLKYYNIRSARTCLGTIRSIIKGTKPGTLLILNFDRPAEIFFFAEFFKTIKDRKFGVALWNPYFQLQEFLPIILSKDSKYLIISDKEYLTLFFNKHVSYHFDKLIVYNKDWIDENGYIDIKGINKISEWQIINGRVLIKIVVPIELRGQEALLSVFLRDITDNKLINPTNVRLSVHGLNENAADTSDWRHLFVSIPSYLTEKGLIIASVLLTYDGSNNSTVEGDIALERVDLKTASQK
jgi:hypothetical protein